MFDTATIRAAWELGNNYDIHPGDILAVAEVESAGKVFARVDGRNEPVIRWEGHYFDRRLTPEQRKKARAAKLASPKAGGIPNPRSQADRWKLLNRAIEINARAAMESVSWGLGQVMGSHWELLGYASVDELVNEARRGADGQIALMVKFIVKNGLKAKLKRGDWAGFARSYNGPAYKKNRYDTKMAAASAKWRKYDFTAFDREAAKPEPKPAPKPVEPAKPVPEPVKTSRGPLALLAALVAAIAAWLATQSCNWFGWFCGG